jgi:hypothetical protein
MGASLSLSSLFGPFSLPPFTDFPRSYAQLFIVNACITAAVAFFGYYAMPDYPNNPNPIANWLKPRHIEAALARMERSGRKLPSGWTWKKFLAVVTSWRIWVIWVGCVAFLLFLHSYLVLTLSSLIATRSSISPTVVSVSFFAHPFVCTD